MNSIKLGNTKPDSIKNENTVASTKQDSLKQSSSKLKKPEPLKDWSRHSYPSPIPFVDFIALSQASLAQRKEVMSDLLSQSSLTLADGLIVLRETEKAMVCDFYNRDGSKAEMCGNAACCLAFYLSWLGLNIKEFFLGTQKIRLDLKGAVILDKPKKEPLLFTKPFPFYFIDTGVPHGVIPCDETHFPSDNFFFEKTKSLKEKAQTLRFKNIEHYKEGMNVSFYQALSNNHLKAITFERGVEDFTLACGTGALAVSLTHSHKSNLEKESMMKKNLYNKESSSQEEKTQNNLFKVEMPGGGLTVEIREQLKLYSQVKKGF